MRGVGGQLAARAAEAALSLVLLVTLTFFLAHAMPGGPGYAILGNKAQPVAVDAVNLQLGIDTPLWVQYVTWWRHLAGGSLGNSYLLNRPVAPLLADYAGRTLPLQAAGLGLGVLLSLVGGLLHGALYTSWAGKLLGTIELIVYATPGFVIGTFLVLVCEGWLPPGGIADLHHVVPSLADRLLHLILPALCVGLMTYAGLARYMAESVDAELGRPYTRTAAAKGLGRLAILLRHVAPNAVRPVVTLLGLSLPALFAGSVVIESQFAYPGLGWLLWRSALSHDYPVLVGGVLVVGAATILGNLLADALNAALDPRTRLA
jgi:peptide/nickel transport system permease protein